jgi:hypothetical protein
VLILAALPFIVVAALPVLYFAGWVPLLVVGLLIVSDQWPPARGNYGLLLGLGLSALGAVWGAGLLWSLVENAVEKAEAQQPGSGPGQRLRWAVWLSVLALVGGCMAAIGAFQ